MTRPRAADDFATIRARMEELRREREGGHASEGELGSNPPLRQGGIERRPPSEVSSGRDVSSKPGRCAAKLNAELLISA